ncbi:gamma-tubulin complex component 3-like [Macadamia integrifolia]|uniref:gamma-tubulin complex component 3-like n=1 Tax=Macadamia integrifolia TaxID=60698 RepID=UPI001C4E74E2|nr:gamma-tubulin complex component 3-like [Macadamia integrifolia]XP_042490827.1 gamma-tubulin complex component 3-like [Macadamia integrifolia]XP_042490828.1 gamma-tubulin complex component 3-like [Macadamia integrifolia]XP_042490829.1 gamma-tubulin complex component 3-like [Macadamia integrifolia]
MEDQRVLDLVKQLVVRLLSPNPNSSEQSIHSIDIDKSLKYAMRILGTRMTPSISIDEAAMAESIKRNFVNQGKSSEALTFADLYSKFSFKSGPGSMHNKWAVLYLLKVISEDRRKEKRSDSRVSSAFLSSTVSGGLPVLFENDRGSRNQKPPDKGWNGGVLLVSKDPDNLRDIAFREFADLLKEESDVSESHLVRDVLYACQGINGKYVKFDKSIDAYVLPDSIKVPRATRIMVRKLCELGWLFRKVKGYISESMDRFPAEDVGTVGQAFCAALQDELAEYYKLLAVLEAQSMNPIPLVSEVANSGNYLSLRRLSVWFAEPMVKMRLMAVLVDSCRVLRGGAMAGAIHMHSQHGDPLVQDFMRRLLRRICSPLFEMVRSWVLEGELDDIFAEFFVLGQPVKAESLWQEGYRLHAGMLPSFIPQSLAQRILRTGKSINFLRVCCEDQGWADAATEAAAVVGTTTRRWGLGYGEIDALESLVIEAAKRIDKHLMDVMYNRYKFKEHCLAIKRYLLLGQGDFVQYLMDTVGPELSEPANTISSFKLAGLLESAIRASNAQYDHDKLDRLRVKMMPHGTGDRGWDVFSLEYEARVPLNTVFTESVMARYLRIFNFLWKLRRVEHALIGAWKTMKPNCISSNFFLKQEGSSKLQFTLALRRCQALWDEMNHFVTNLQYYIMFEVLEVSWSNFSNEMEAAKDLDDLLAAHEKYLHSIVEKSLLGECSQTLSKTLFVLFDLILQFRSHADRLYEGIHELQARTMDTSLSSRTRSRSKSKSNNESSGYGTRVGGGRKALTHRAGEFLRNMREDLDTIAKEYSSLLEGFIAQLPVQQHVDLKFLLFRLDFTEFYSHQRLCT